MHVNYVENDGNYVDLSCSGYLFLPLWHLSGHLPSEVFVDGIMYAGADVGCKPDAACHGVFPLCFGKVW